MVVTWWIVAFAVIKHWFRQCLTENVSSSGLVSGMSELPGNKLIVNLALRDITKIM